MTYQHVLTYSWISQQYFVKSGTFILLKTEEFCLEVEFQMMTRIIAYERPA